MKIFICYAMACDDSFLTMPSKIKLVLIGCLGDKCSFPLSVAELSENFDFGIDDQGKHARTKKGFLSQKAFVEGEKGNTYLINILTRALESVCARVEKTHQTGNT